MRVIIIGSSIAGASAALALSKYANVNVFEQKKKQDIGKKLCANVVTPSFFNYSKELGLDAKQFIASKFSKAVFISKSNGLFLRTKEFRIDRQKFLDAAIKKAAGQGAKFYFETEFLDFKREKNKFVIYLRKGKKNVSVKADALIGADGALSRVAEKANLSKGRKNFLVMQSEVPLKSLKFRVDRDAYYIHLNREFGYYSYIFPFKDKAIIGSGNIIERAKENYSNFLKFLEVHPKKISAALIPFPQKTHFRKNLVLIGDAAGSVKFSGGGIVPSMADAIAARNLLIRKDSDNFRVAKNRIFMNRLASKVFLKMKDKDLDYLLDVMKDKKFSGLLEKRDKFGKGDYSKALDIRFWRFLPKLL